MDKQIRILVALDWQYFSYSDDQLIQFLSEFGKQLGDDFKTIALWINEYEDRCSYINIELRNSEVYQKLSSPRRSLQVHRLCADTCSAEACAEFKKEAYRIKRLLKRKFPDKCVTSCFCWR